MTAVARKPVPVAAPISPATLPKLVTRRGVLVAPVRIVVYGVDGVGKSTFAAGAPRPIFISTDAGTEHLDVERAGEGQPQAWDEVLDQIRALTNNDHDFQTLVIDPLGWLEPLCWRQVCANAGVKTIEEVGGGYQKGYAAAVELWRTMIAELERLREVRRMNIILVAHATIRNQKNPEGDSFDRHNLAIHEKAADVFRQWADAVLFARHEYYSKKVGQKVRGVSTGARVLQTQWCAAYDAKNRLNLPEELPLSWDDFWSAVSANRVDAFGARAEAVRKQISALLEELSDEGVTANAARYVKDAGDNVPRLIEVLNAVRVKLGEKGESNG